MVPLELLMPVEGGAVLGRVVGREAWNGGSGLVVSEGRIYSGALSPSPRRSRVQGELWLASPFFPSAVMLNAAASGILLLLMASRAVPTMRRSRGRIKARPGAEARERPRLRREAGFTLTKRRRRQAGRCGDVESPGGTRVRSEGS